VRVLELRWQLVFLKLQLRAILEWLLLLKQAFQKINFKSLL
jgi:hypothetical protein